MTIDSEDRRKYVELVLDLYTTVPGVLGRLRRADRELADRLYDDDVPFYAIRNAFILAAARRIKNNAFATPLPQIRSLHYFRPVIQEVLERPPGSREINEMLQLLERHAPEPLR